MPMKHALMEDLGNLESLPDWVKKTLIGSKSKGWGYDDCPIERFKLGKGSEIKRINGKFADIEKEMTAAVKSKVVIVKINGELTLIYPAGAQYKDKTKIVTKDSTDIIKGFKAPIKDVMHELKALDKDVKVYVITPDADRARMNAERKKARVGVIPRKKARIAPYSSFDKSGGLGRISDNKSWARSAYFDLKKRLDAYKIEKAKRGKTFASPEDLMKHMIDEGFIDIAIVGEFTYRLERINGRVEDLITGRNPGDVYVEYKIDDDERHDAYKEISDKLASEMPDTSFEERYEEVRKLLPPAYIKVHYGIDKTTIKLMKVTTKNWI